MYIHQAYNYFHAGNYQKALVAFRSMPDYEKYESQIRVCVDALLGQGDKLVMEHQYSQALELFKLCQSHAFDMKGKNKAKERFSYAFFRWMFVKGEKFFQAKAYEQAEESFQKASKVYHKHLFPTPGLFEHLENEFPLKKRLTFLSNLKKEEEIHHKLHQNGHSSTPNGHSVINETVEVDVSTRIEEIKHQNKARFSDHIRQALRHYQYKNYQQAKQFFKKAEEIYATPKVKEMLEACEQVLLIRSKLDDLYNG